MLHALVLAAQALPVGDRAKDARAEQSVALRLGYFAVRPAADFLRRGQADAARVEIGNWVSELKWVRTEQVVLLSCGARRRGLQDPAPLTRPLSAPVSIHLAGAASCGSSGGSGPDPQRSVCGDGGFDQGLLTHRLDQLHIEA